MTEKRHILMVAAENGALDGGKVGGLGDVIREAPPVLARYDCAVSVLTPSYGFLHHNGDTRTVSLLELDFGGARHQAALLEVPAASPAPGVTHFVIDHPLFESRDPATGRHRIYTPDPPEAPFASDATKFALFGTAVAEALKQGLFGRPTCLHLHDWHTAFVLILRRCDEGYRELQATRTAFSIHNLALQGVRPFQGHPSSFKSWFPRLQPDWRDVIDPRWPVCINPMAAAIRLADSVHTVSPSYAAEILRPSDPPRFFGGEGLEEDLRRADAEGRLFGILNGCAYPWERAARRRSHMELAALLQSQLLRWAGSQDFVAGAHFIAHARLEALAARPVRPDMLLTAVTRTVEQKLLLLKSAGTRCPSGLAGLLETLGGRGVFILLGTGDPAYEKFLAETSSRFENFIFLNGYSDACADALYASGDLFMMPSSFEPCGIGQMLAMRDGQPCLAHCIGGLKDTVDDAVNGFTFGGDSVAAQVDGMIQTLRRAIDLQRDDPAAWAKIRQNAAAAAFDWHESVRRYLEQLYT